MTRGTHTTADGAEWCPDCNGPICNIPVEDKRGRIVDHVRDCPECLDRDSEGGGDATRQALGGKA